VERRRGGGHLINAETTCNPPSRLCLCQESVRSLSLSGCANKLGPFACANSALLQRPNSKRRKRVRAISVLNLFAQQHVEQQTGNFAQFALNKALLNCIATLRAQDVHLAYINKLVISGIISDAPSNFALNERNWKTKPYIRWQKSTNDCNEQDIAF
jgi:hypothetical protein